jgi:3-methyl-2-oxobutanoate hydroxymethyltransferase
MNNTSNTSGPKKITTKVIAGMKKDGIRIACLTAYDYITARLLDQAGVDLLLVGDSLGMVFQGHQTTIAVTLDEMIYHAKTVVRAVERAMIIVDLPFMSYQANDERSAYLVRITVRAGIPVLGHLGLTPQSIHQFGGYTPRGVDRIEATQLLKDAKALEEAGAFGIVLEKIPAALAGKVTRSLKIPTISIGAGPRCDGQVLVTPDLLGLYEDFHPRFVRNYAHLAETIRQSVGAYVKDVKDGKFPTAKESY